MSIVKELQARLKRAKYQVINAKYQHIKTKNKTRVEVLEMVLRKITQWQSFNKS